MGDSIEIHSTESEPTTQEQNEQDFRTLIWFHRGTGVGTIVTLYHLKPLPPPIWGTDILHPSLESCLV